MGALAAAPASSGAPVFVVIAYGGVAIEVEIFASLVASARILHDALDERGQVGCGVGKDKLAPMTNVDFFAHASLRWEAHFHFLKFTVGGLNGVFAEMHRILGRDGIAHERQVAQVSRCVEQVKVYVRQGFVCV